MPPVSLTDLSLIDLLEEEGTAWSLAAALSLRDCARLRTTGRAGRGLLPGTWPLAAHLASPLRPPPPGPTRLPTAAHLVELLLHWRAVSPVRWPLEALQALQALHDHRDEHGRLLLHRLVHAGRTEAVFALLRSGLHPDTRDSTGSTPLHVAADRGRRDAAHVLVQAGADLNLRRDADGSTAMHLCAQLGDPRTLRVLMKGGADVSLTDGGGRTALCILEPRGVETHRFEMARLGVLWFRSHGTPQPVGEEQAALYLAQDTWSVDACTLGSSGSR